MDVLLINPPWEQLSEDVRAKARVSNLMPSLGLGYIAAVLERNGVDVQILDANVDGISPANLARYLLRGGWQPKHIGITATSHTIATALAMATACKEALPTCAVTLGGVHPTILPEESLACNAVDFVVRSEGEFTYLELVTGRNMEGIEGLSFKRDGCQIHNPPRPAIAELDQLPFPAFHLMPVHKYHPSLGTYRELPAMGVIGSRGCPFNCTYCASPAFWGRTVRFRSARSIVDEIALLVKSYGVREIQLLDDTFTVSQKRFREFCELLLEADFRITWSCNSRVDSADDDLLKLMKAAGCHSILYGIESADEEMLARVKKRTSLDQARTAIALTKKNGITCRTSFIFGNPGETWETIEKTVQFALETMPDFVIFNIIRPYPGTEVYEWACAMGGLMRERWYMSPESGAIMRLPDLSRQDLAKAQSQAMRRFYVRPRYALSRVSKVRSLKDLRMYVDGFVGLLRA
jgi:anaerobic magnesium-protoporphyrin IX monomethyl ester cyclase